MIFYVAEVYYRHLVKAFLVHQINFNQQIGRSKKKEYASDWSKTYKVWESRQQMFLIEGQEKENIFKIFKSIHSI